jgi:biotin-dependent carboxylase-like uncharacterized protein
VSVLEVVRAGALTTVQDLGRPGFAHLAVPRSGALDEPSFRLANRLVGNPEGWAGLETTVDGVAVRLGEDRHIAVTGAPASVRIDGRTAEWGVAQWVRAGHVVEVGRAQSGLRSYLAIAGGLQPEPVLGSRSTDLLSGLGPAPLVTGDAIALGQPAGPAAGADHAIYPPIPAELRLDCQLGPRADWFTAAAVDALASVAWRVTERSNRIGLRLSGLRFSGLRFSGLRLSGLPGPALERRTPDELPSEGLVLGAVQVPADGQPVIFLADHPTTGGYPVIGVLPRADVWRCGQAAPGTTIRLRVRRSGAPIDMPARRGQLRSDR